MKEELVKRVLTVAEHIKESHDTVRKTAKLFGLSKSIIHNDVSVKLKAIDYDLYLQTKVVLDENFAEKHIRGGEATKKKYQDEFDETEFKD